MTNHSLNALCRSLCVLTAAASTAAAAQDGPVDVRPDAGPHTITDEGSQTSARDAGPVLPIPGIDGLSDPLVAIAIENELWEARALDANDIDVEVAQGVVTFTGTVDDILTRERAVRVATLTRGVASVIDRLTVAPSGLSDATIGREVEIALLADPATEAWEIATSVHEGNVTLSGTVQSDAERRLAERVAKSVRGVRSVDNRLEAAYERVRADAEMASEIRSMLDWDVRLDTRLITVDVANGEVALGGRVGSAFERRLATEIAWVPGVSAVDNSRLEVEWWRRDAMQRDRVPTQFADVDVRAAVERALSADPRVSSFSIEAIVENGTATLRGTVDNLKARRVAAEAARNTVGVERVQNHLKVRPEVVRGDAELASDVRAALARDAVLAGDRITATVDGTEVRLSGTVLSPFERAHAADVATRVTGVSSVANGLRVSFDGPDYTYGHDWDPLLYDYDYDRDDAYVSVYVKSDQEIEREIEDELFWSPYVDANEVRVSVEDGVATLRGRVNDLYESRKAAENALEGGAYRVRNRLSIDP